jgi:hypothetical protein
MFSTRSIERCKRGAADLHICPFPYLAIAPEWPFQVSVLRFDGDKAARGHGLSGVRYEVHDGFRKMDRRAQGVKQGRIQRGLNFDNGMEGNQAFEFRTLQVPGDQVVKVQHLRSRHASVG